MTYSSYWLLLLPQRYKFSSKSQPVCKSMAVPWGCCCYRKGTNFQANHNLSCHTLVPNQLLLLPQRYKFSSKSQPGFAAWAAKVVVVATAKVQIFKQITTASGSFRKAAGCCCYRKGTNFQANHNQVLSSVCPYQLLLLPQRYKFSSKSQLHERLADLVEVVVATAKVQIFKQITTVTKR